VNLSTAFPGRKANRGMSILSIKLIGLIKSIEPAISDGFDCVLPSVYRDADTPTPLQEL
jgi:hypothetical protein